MFPAAIEVAFENAENHLESKLGNYEISPTEAKMKRKLNRRRRTFVGESSATKAPRAGSPTLQDIDTNIDGGFDSDLLLSPMPPSGKKLHNINRAKHSKSEPPKPNKAGGLDEEDVRALEQLDEMNKMIDMELGESGDEKKLSPAKKKKNNGRRRRTFNVTFGGGTGGGNREGVVEPRKDRSKFSKAASFPVKSSHHSNDGEKDNISGSLSVKHGKINTEAIEEANKVVRSKSIG